MSVAVHPLYRDEAKVKELSEWFLSGGHSVFQMFQFCGNEKAHSEFLLEASDPQRRTKRVLSLGCGVGGMEAYWRKVRGELEFELVNTSRVQLDMSLCAGRKVCASAENYLSEKGPFDLVVVAYVLGHVNPVATLLGTLKNMVKGSRLIVYDVFSGSERFNAAMHYESPRLQDVRWFGFEHDLLLRCMYTGGIPMCALMKELVPWVEKEVTPALFIFEK